MQLLSPSERASIIRNYNLGKESQKRDCEDSLAAFIHTAWHIIEPGAPLVWNWHVDTICGYLEAVSSGQITRLIINVPPGTLKSTIVSVAFNAWEWIKRPEERYLCLSNEQGLAIRDALKTKQIVTSEWYQDKWPLALQSDQNEKTLYVNEKRGFRQSQGISAANTGKRGSRVLIDDPHDMRQVFSDVVRQGVLDTWDNSLSTRLNDPEKSAVILIMQRGHESDLAGHLLKKQVQKWVHLSIPMEYEDSPSFDAGADIGRPELNDPRTKKGELLFPARFTRQSIESLKEDLGEYGAAAQLQQRPVPSGGGIIKSFWWRIWPDDQPMPVCEHVFLSYDTAFSEADMKNSAFSAMTRWGVFWHEQRQRYCLMCLGRWYDRIGYDKLRLLAKEWDMKYKPDAHLIEKKATGITLIQDLRRALKSKVRSYCPGKGEDKVSRAHSVSPMFQGGIVYIPNKKWATNTEKTGLIDFVAAFPNGAPPSADLCFVAGTLIATTRGQIPIEYIKNTDMVLTPFGWKKVIDCGCTGIKEVITNIGLTGTHNHPIYTFDKGFITLDTITHSSKIMRISICDFIKIVCQEKLSLMDSNFIGLQKKASILLGDMGQIKNQKDYMWLYGNFTIIKKFLKDMRLIISIMTTITTSLITLSAYRLKCIDHYLKRILIEKSNLEYLVKLGRLQLNGIDQRKAGNGIVKMLKTTSALLKSEKSFLKIGKRLKEQNHVNGVESNLNLRASAGNTVARLVNAKKADGDLEKVTTLTNTMQKVFNLTVDEVNCYFANGILVHNCDTVTQACIYLRSGLWVTHPDDDEESDNSAIHNQDIDDDDMIIESKSLYA